MKFDTTIVNETLLLLRVAARKLREKGFCPEKVITDYIRSGDPTYFYQLDKELRIKICKIEPEDLSDIIVHHILN